MKSLRKGIGDRKDIENYYDNWSSSYDKTLYQWEYKAPLQSVNILKKYIKIKSEDTDKWILGMRKLYNKFVV